MGFSALVGLSILVALGGPAFGGEPGGPAAAAPAAVNAGDTAWVLISAALVMLMTPALAFFYGGLVRRKNMLSVLMQCLMILCPACSGWRSGTVCRSGRETA
jgi:Amt family ammonium transporter